MTEQPRVTFRAKQMIPQERATLSNSRYPFSPRKKRASETSKPQTSHNNPSPSMEMDEKIQVSGKMEAVVKISQIPNHVETIKNGWKRFKIDAEGQILEMKIRPRAWNKLLRANAEWPLWTATISGKLGPRIKAGFRLLEVTVQVYEKKVKTADE
jgi:hypothetical protein